MRVAGVLRVHAPAPAAAISLSLLVGVAIPLLNGDLKFLVALGALTAIPLALVIASRNPVACFGAMIAAQVLDGYQLATPLVTLSLRNLLTITMLVFTWRTFREETGGNPPLRIVSALFLVWFGLHVLQIRHLGVDEVTRIMFTQASFLMVAAIAAALSRRSRAYPTVASAAAAALLTLGVLGTLAGIGILPLPLRVQAERELLGIGSPIVRNYGLNVPFDAVSLLASVAIPYFMVRFIRLKRGENPLAALAVIIALGMTILFVFQARGMVLQVLIALGATIWITGKKIRWILVPVGFVLLMQASISLVTADTISSSLRSATSMVTVRSAWEDPAEFVLGADENRLIIEGAREAGWLAAINQARGANIIHNLFLHYLASNGVISFLMILAAHLYVTRHAYRYWRRNPGDLQAQALLVAILLVMFELNIEPVRANVIGNWVIIGLIMGKRLRVGGPTRGAVGSVPNSDVAPSSR